ncbi:MAG: F0F1 ATP synthase subunit A [Candidatus Vogelbacteria bacterium]|nr:F0F1 ATP synthase subunit A [Candidatus Vogelbacteria bacterium]
MEEISIAAEKIFSIGNFPVTNSLILSVLVLAILSLASFVLFKNIKTIPGKIQSIVEMVLEGIMNFMDTILGHREITEKYLPIVGTIFFFVLFSNWSGLFPGLGALGLSGFNEAGKETFVPLLRAPSSDLNFTLALGIIAILSVNVLGVAAIGVRHHLGKFFNFESPVMFFVGILELISEFVKMISLAFRLFGNVFAGEVLLLVIGMLSPYVLPLPFLLMEIFVGFIQALIFSVLTLVFINMAVEHSPAH